MNTLPLSWCRKDTEYSTYHTVRLPLSRMTWVSTAELPFVYTDSDIYQDLTSNYPDFVIRGLCHDTAKYFLDKGADVVRTGSEAVVDLFGPHTIRHSVLELAKRGLRHGSVEEVQYTEINEEKLKRLMSESSHGKEPRLLYLYRTGFDTTTRCFVFKGPDNLWLGAVTISQRDEFYVHTESIIRRNDAPVGVMEALFVSLIHTLQAEAYKYLSLGEVPLVRDDDAPELSMSFSSKLIFRSKALLGHLFNYKGLYSFKNKFGPDWSPVYLAAKPAVSRRLLIDLYFKSRFHDLTVFKVIDSLKKRIHLPHKTA